MSESEFWEALRERIIRSGVLGALGYCDWIEVKRYVLGGMAPRIDGLVGFVDGRRADRYRFTLVLPETVESIDEIDWRGLLPESGSRAGWVKVEGDLIAIDTIGDIDERRLREGL